MTIKNGIHRLDGRLIAGTPPPPTATGKLKCSIEARFINPDTGKFVQFIQLDYIANGLDIYVGQNHGTAPVNWIYCTHGVGF